MKDIVMVNTLVCLPGYSFKHGGGVGAQQDTVSEQAYVEVSQVLWSGPSTECHNKKMHLPWTCSPRLLRAIQDLYYLCWQIKFMLQVRSLSYIKSQRKNYTNKNKLTWIAHVKWSACSRIIKVALASKIWKWSTVGHFVYTDSLPRLLKRSSGGQSEMDGDYRVCCRLWSVQLLVWTK